MSDGRLPERLAAEIARRYCGDEGAPLPSERRLSAELGASRAMVREALAILRVQGLIVGGQGHPAIVHSPSADAKGLEAMEARAVLEGEIAALSALRAGPEGHARLRERLRAMFAAESPAAYWQAEQRLHLSLLETAQNSVLRGLCEPLLAAAYDCLPPEDFSERLRSHQFFVAAIGRAQPQLARDLLMSIVSPSPAEQSGG